jgi:hypothetical protein
LDFRRNLRALGHPAAATPGSEFVSACAIHSSRRPEIPGYFTQIGGT